MLIAIANDAHRSMWSCDIPAAMLATQLNDKVTSGQMDNFSVIRLDKYICNPIQPDRLV